jgi:hypothetical protein
MKEMKNFSGHEKNSKIWSLIVEVQFELVNNFNKNSANSSNNKGMKIRYFLLNKTWQLWQYSAISEEFYLIFFFDNLQK